MSETSIATEELTPAERATAFDAAIRAAKDGTAAAPPPQAESRYVSALWLGGQCLGVWPGHIAPSRRVRLDGRDYVARPCDSKAVEQLPTRGGWQTCLPVELLPAKAEDAVLVINTRPAE